MSIFPGRKKNKEGRISQIKKLHSPYLKNSSVSFRKNPKSSKKISSLMIPPARLTPPSNRWKKILAVILALGISGYVIYVLFFSDLFFIRKYKVEIEGTVIDSNETINNILAAQSGKNIILLDNQKIIDEIIKLQPEVKKVEVKKIFPDTLIVSFEKYPTVANITNIINGIQKKFLVDSQGLITEENSENPNLPYIKLETQTPLEVRNTFLNNSKKAAERLTYIIQAINLYEEKFGMKIMFARLLLKEREIHLYTEKGFYVMIDMGKDLKSQIDKLKKALSKLDIYHIPLIYIDLRISGNNVEKVIYKRKKT